MNLAIFTYSFPHTKTADGVFHLLANGFKPSLFVAAPPVELTFAQSKRRLYRKDCILHRLSSWQSCAEQSLWLLLMLLMNAIRRCADTMSM